MKILFLIYFLFVSCNVSIDMAKVLEAAENNNQAKLNYYFQNGFDCFQTNEHGNTILLEVSKKESQTNDSTMSTLINFGCSLLQDNDHGELPLDNIYNFRSKESVESIIYGLDSTIFSDLVLNNFYISEFSPFNENSFEIIDKLKNLFIIHCDTVSKNKFFLELISDWHSQETEFRFRNYSDLSEQFEALSLFFINNGMEIPQQYKLHEYHINKFPEDSRFLSFYNKHYKY